MKIGWKLSFFWAGTWFLLYLFFFWRALTVGHSYTWGTEIQQIKPFWYTGDQLKKISKEAPRVRYLIVTQHQAKTHKLSLVSSMMWIAFATTDNSSWTRFGRLIWVSESFTSCLPSWWGTVQTSVWNRWKPKRLLNLMHDGDLRIWQGSFKPP